MRNSLRDKPRRFHDGARKQCWMSQYRTILTKIRYFRIVTRIGIGCTFRFKNKQTLYRVDGRTIDNEGKRFTLAIYSRTVEDEVTKDAFCNNFRENFPYA